MDDLLPHQRHHIKARAANYRKNNADFASWAKGYGVIKHDDLTQVRVHDLIVYLVEIGKLESCEAGYNRFRAADKIACGAMWLVAHMTYVDRVYLDGRYLESSDFKADPQGHMGGALNIAVAYSGYMLANSLDGNTRSWLMGQGHCVAAIDAVNLLLDNLSDAQQGRYALSDDGVTQLVRDFYSYEIDQNGRAASPLGSHVNPNTGGGIIEGGYLGFAELLYPHMPLKNERLVAFLSDGAFEEQRGSDWAARWWRAEDSGLVAPIMIANGRRIDQRSTMAQTGGVDWFRKHLELNGFDPIDIDGRDPASFAWAIFEIESRLSACSDACENGSATYPVPLHYGIAETIKGFGFPGASTNAAHNLPLGANPKTNDKARKLFNDGAKALLVPLEELKKAADALNTHEAQNRPKERNHPIASRDLVTPVLPQPSWQDVGNAPVSPMAGVDAYFHETILANPDLRVRVGNPDEMRSNNLNLTLDLLKHRVTAPEEGVAESIQGSVITALNEEAVVCAALGNKGGINLVCSYEAFAVKMLGALRQDIIFSRNQRNLSKDQFWLSVPIILTSHTWENGKNEQSHQDPTLCETLMGEMADVSRVLFPADYNSAQASLRATYRDHGAIWSLVIPKRPQPVGFSSAQSEKLVAEGAIKVFASANKEADLQLVAIGAYQLAQLRIASERLSEKGVAHSLIYMLEPSRFREPRDKLERAVCSPTEVVQALFPASATKRVFLSHMRPEVAAGILRPLDTGKYTKFLGYSNQGGTLCENGLLYANGCMWAHVLQAVAEVSDIALEGLLSPAEQSALQGKQSPILLWEKEGRNQ